LRKLPKECKGFKFGRFFWCEEGEEEEERLDLVEESFCKKRSETVILSVKVLECLRCLVWPALGTRSVAK